jgi:hypothetical protein
MAELVEHVDSDLIAAIRERLTLRAERAEKQLRHTAQNSGIQGRVSKGIPTGGQFSERNRSESDIAL